MSEAVYIRSNGSTARKRCLDVSKKINKAATDINSAKNELNDVDYVNVSYEIDQLKTMYTTDNTQASEFETFASTLEAMIDDYISTDKSCAKKIKSSGRQHRKDTGLPKSLALATISASFDKIGNKLDNVADNVKKWADGVVDWVNGVIDTVKTSIKEDWESYFQGIEGVMQLVTSVGTLAAAIAAAATGAGIIVAIPMLVASLVTMYTGVDKIASSFLDIANVYETDGSTITKEVVDNPVFDLVYDLSDIVAGIYTGAGIGKLAEEAVDGVELFTLLGKGEFAEKVSKFIQNADKIGNVGDTIGDIEDVVSFLVNLREKDASGLLSQGKDFMFDKIADFKIGDIPKDIAVNMIKNKNVLGVLR